MRGGARIPDAPVILGRADPSPSRRRGARHMSVGIMGAVSPMHVRRYGIDQRGRPYGRTRPTKPRRRGCAPSVGRHGSGRRTADARWHGRTPCRRARLALVRARRADRRHAADCAVTGYDPPWQPLPTCTWSWATAGRGMRTRSTCRRWAIVTTVELPDHLRAVRGPPRGWCRDPATFGVTARRTQPVGCWRDSDRGTA